MSLPTRNNSASVDYDIAVVGSGVVGLLLAALLVKYDFRVALVERSFQAPSLPSNDYDVRVLAMTKASRLLLETVTAWQQLSANRLGTFREMLVWEAQGNAHIHFDSSEINEEALGYIVENSALIRALELAISEHPNITWYRPNSVNTVEVNVFDVTIGLEDGQTFTAKLIVGADGSDSSVRQLTGISSKSHDYQQSALVCRVKTEVPHGNVARQIFMTSGPLAFLPLAEPDQCSIVWSNLPDEINKLLQMSDEFFACSLYDSFEAKLGKILEVGPRARFPLIRAHTEHYVKFRVALVGDAAHRIHPLAGQGANLGFLDAATLVDILLTARDQKRDIGEIAHLRRYERWRKSENLTMMLTMDGFKLLFGTSNKPLFLARNIGLYLANQIDFLKELIIRRAMGMDGDIPQLVTQNRQ